MTHSDEFKPMVSCWLAEAALRRRAGFPWGLGVRLHLYVCLPAHPHPHAACACRGHAGHEQHPERDPGQRGPPGHRAGGRARDGYAAHGRWKEAAWGCPGLVLPPGDSPGHWLAAALRFPLLLHVHTLPIPPAIPAHKQPRPRPPAGSSRMFNWMDYDGSASQRTGPSIVGSWPTWWQLAPDCAFEVCVCVGGGLGSGGREAVGRGRPPSTGVAGWRERGGGMPGGAALARQDCLTFSIHLVTAMPLGCLLSSPLLFVRRMSGTRGCAPGGRARRWGAWSCASPGSPSRGTWVRGRRAGQGGAGEGKRHRRRRGGGQQKDMGEQPAPHRCASFHPRCLPHRTRRSRVTA